MHKLFIPLFFICFLNACSWLVSEPTRVENPVIRGVDYIGMTVSNLEKSSKLYSKAVQLESVQRQKLVGHSVFSALTGQKDLEISTHLMKSVNAQLRLMEFTTPSETVKSTQHLPVYGPGIAHICYQVAKKTNTYQTFLENGATHVGDPAMVHLNPKNLVYYAYARDHDNILFEVEHIDIAALALPTPPKHHYRIRHVSLATTNMDRVVAFYSTLLETQNPRRAGTLINLSGDKLDKISGIANSKIEMAWFQIRNIELEIIQYHNPVPTPLKTPRPVDALGYNSIVFDVEDLEAAKALLLKAGGTIVNEPQPMDNGDIMYGRDPDGNLLGFQKVLDSSPLSSQNFSDNGA